MPEVAVEQHHVKKIEIPHPTPQVHVQETPKISEEKKQVIESQQQVKLAAVRTELQDVQEEKASTKSQAYTEEQKQAIRAFSKQTEAGRAAREATAKDLRAMRRERDLASSEVARLDEKRDNAESERQRIEQLLEAQRSILGKTLRFFRQGSETVTPEMATDREKEYNDLTLEINKTLKFKSEFYHPEAILDRYYNQELARGRKEHRERQEEDARQREKEALDEYKATQGTVEAVSQRYDAYFLHATLTSKNNQIHNPFFKGKNVDWFDKIAVVMDKSPAICTSTVRTDATKTEGIFGTLGVVLNGGSVYDGRPSDFGSQATGLKTRQGVDGRIEGPQNIREYQEHMDIAIMKPNGSKTGYNELIVEEPRVAGVFFDLRAMTGMLPDQSILREYRWSYEEKDGEQVSVRAKNPNLDYNDQGEIVAIHKSMPALPMSGQMNVEISRICRIAEAYGTNAYLKWGNKLYKAEFDPETGSVRRGEYVSPEEIAQLLPREQTEEQRAIVHQRASGALVPESLTYGDR